MRNYPICHIGRHRIGIDGAGIRTLVLVAGCPLRCKYCINPFTWDGSEEPENMTSSMIYERIEKDCLYILATGGGITFGGGEPLLYPDLITEMRQICDPDMTIYIETSLSVDWSNIEKVIGVVDKYYIDIKTMDDRLYHEYTGGELDLVVKNLNRLMSAVGSDRIEVRIPTIPGMVDKTHQEETMNELKHMGIERFDLFDYRTPNA